MSLKDLRKKVFVSVFFSFLCTCEDEGVPPDSRFQACNPPNLLFAAFAVAGSGALQNFFENLMDLFVALASIFSPLGMDQGAAVFGMGFVFGDLVQIGSRVKAHYLFEYCMDLLAGFSCLLGCFRMAFGAFITCFSMGVGGDFKFRMCHNDSSLVTFNPLMHI